MSQHAARRPRVGVFGSDAAYMLQFRGHLLKALHDKGCEVVVICPDDGRIGPILESWGVTFAPLSLHRSRLNPLAELSVAANLLKLLRRQSLDTLLGYTIKPIFYGLPAARALAIPRRVGMVTGFGYALIEGDGLKRRLTRAVALAGYWIACRAANRMIFQNPDDLAFFCQTGLLPKNARTAMVAGSGVDLMRFTAEPLPETPPTFLMVARLLRDKGVYEYVSAARLVKKTDPQARFLLVGGRDNNHASVTEAEIDAWRAEGVVELIGHVDDVRPYLRQAHVFVLPSYREGTPRSCLEAMAVGRPVITTDAPGCREVVRPGRSGLLVPVRDAEALARAMLELARDPAMVKVMAEESRRFCEERFDANLVTRDIMDVLLDPVALT